MTKAHILRPGRKIALCGLYGRPAAAIPMDEVPKVIDSQRLCQRCKLAYFKEGFHAKQPA